MVFARFFKKTDTPVARMADWQSLLQQAPVVLTYCLAGGGMSALAYITTWARALGPVGVGGIGLASALLAWVGISAAQTLRAKGRARDAETAAIERWQREVSNINPLSREFHTQRIKIADLASPIDGRVKSKRFIDCEILGPSNIFFEGRGSLTGSVFNGCDFVVPRLGALIYNVIAFNDCDFINCQFWKCTIFMPKDMLDRLDFEVPIVTLTGDARFDTQPPPGT